MRSLLLGVLLLLTVGMVNADSNLENAKEAAGNIGHSINNTLMCVTLYTEEEEMQACLLSVLEDLAENVQVVAGSSFAAGHAVGVLECQ